jgi:hypothetical protein
MSQQCTAGALLSAFLHRIYHKSYKHRAAHKADVAVI